MTTELFVEVLLELTRSVAPRKIFVFGTSTRRFANDDVTGFPPGRTILVAVGRVVTPSEATRGTIFLIIFLTGLDRRAGLAGRTSVCRLNTFDF